MTKKFKWWPRVAAWVVLVILSSYIRLYPLRSHMWDDAREQATLMVVYNIKQTFLKQILAQAPTMPPSLDNHMAEEKLNETMHKEKRKFMDAIERVTMSLAHEPGAPPQKIYLLESDPYDFYNLTENIVHTGRIAKVIKGSKYFNPLMCAPFGFWQPFTLHPYWGFVIYKLLRIFDPGISLMTAVAYTPLFIYSIILMAFLWVCRVLNFSAVSSFVGALFLVMAPINLKRGSLGWFRTDPYNILFPLLLLGCLFLALRPASKKDGYLWAVIFGLILGVYALFWQGWGLLFFIGMACALSAALYNFYIKKDRVHARQNLLFLPIFTGATLLVVTMCFSFQDFFILIKEGFGELSKFTHRGLDVWPNQFLTVGELEKTSIINIITSAGGPVFMLLALGGWFYSLRLVVGSPKQNRSIDTLIISIFLLVTMTLSVFGERFVLFATIPLSILAAGAANRFIGLRSAGLPLAGLLIALVLFDADRDIRTVLTPIYNSTWDEALTKIKKDSPPDSIVNTWWAPGHFIKGMAHRAVPFDGASLDQGPAGFWMGNMFLAQDENQARGILRMLNSSGNQAAEYLVKCGLKLSDATTLLLNIVSQDKTQAAQTLQGILNEDQIRTLLSMTHGKNPHSYALVYTELVDDNLMIAFNGHWNIKKIEEINSNPELLKKVPNRQSHDFIEFLWKTMGGPPKYSDNLALLGENNHQLVFREGLTIDLATMDAKIQSSTYGTGAPLSVFYVKDGAVTEHLNPGGMLNYSVVLYQEDGQYVARLMDRDLANSMIMKLYYFDGAGLKYFKPLILSHDLTGRTRIKVFQVLY
jgi:dolichyl-diphosphooligosaccharide--protein glycosyltransferase